MMFIKFSSCLILAVGLQISCTYIVLANPELDLGLHQVSKDDLAFGEAQTDAMVHDRPRMLEFAKRGDNLWDWVSKHFAGASTGEKFYWEANPRADAPTRDGRPARPVARHCFPMPGSSARRWVTVNDTDEDGYMISPEDMWASVVFEFLNTRNDKSFAKLNQDALARKLSRDEYEKETLKLEFDTHNQVNSTFDRIIANDGNARNLHTGYGGKHFKVSPMTFEEWFRKYKASRNYIPYYTYFYDNEIVPRLESSPDSSEPAACPKPHP
jgi:hypothetical protein